MALSLSQTPKVVGEYQTRSMSIRPLEPTTLARFGPALSLDERVLAIAPEA